MVTVASAVSGNHSEEKVPITIASFESSFTALSAQNSVALRAFVVVHGRFLPAQVRPSDSVSTVF